MSDTNTDASASTAPEAESGRSGVFNCNQENAGRVSATKLQEEEGRPARDRIHVFVAMDCSTFREALIRMLHRRSGVLVQEIDRSTICRLKVVPSAEHGVLLLGSRGSTAEDLKHVHELQICAPKIRILLLGMALVEGEFLRFLRAGVSGYLPEDTSGEEVLRAIEVIAAGGSVCPGSFCGVVLQSLREERRFCGGEFANGT